MAIVVESVTVKDEEDSNPVGTTYRYAHTLANGSGNNRAVFVFSSLRRGASRTLSSVTSDPAGSAFAGTVYQNVSVDGGQACSTAVAYFLDDELPSSSGSVDLDLEWSADALARPALIVELSGVDQTTPVENFASTTDTDQIEGGTLSATLSGSSGKFAFSYLSATDNDNTNFGLATPAHTVPSGMTLRGDAKLEVDGSAGTSSTSVATIASAASASEAYTWTYSWGGSVDIDSLVTGTFAVNEAAGGGPTVSVPIMLQSYRQRRV